MWKIFASLICLTFFQSACAQNKLEALDKASRNHIGLGYSQYIYGPDRNAKTYIEDESRNTFQFDLIYNRHLLGQFSFQTGIISFHHKSRTIYNNPNSTQINYQESENQIHSIFLPLRLNWATKGDFSFLMGVSVNNLIFSNSKSQSKGVTPRGPFERTGSGTVYGFQNYLFLPGIHLGADWQLKRNYQIRLETNVLFLFGKSNVGAGRVPNVLPLQIAVFRKL